MKRSLLLLPLILVAACAQTTVKRTYVANTVPPPEAVYVKPFTMKPGAFVGYHGNTGERPLREALAPMEFANVLSQQMSRMAPSRVLREGEAAPVGWVIDGEFDLVDGGDPYGRAAFGKFGLARSTVVIHVRVRDAVDGRVLFAFDVTGGSGATGHVGNTGAPGLGVARMFDFRNAADTIYITLTPDPYRHGFRSSI